MKRKMFFMAELVFVRGLLHMDYTSIDNHAVVDDDDDDDDDVDSSNSNSNDNDDKRLIFRFHFIFYLD